MFMFDWVSVAAGIHVYVVDTLDPGRRKAVLVDQLLSRGRGTSHVARVCMSVYMIVRARLSEHALTHNRSAFPASTW